MAGSDPGQHREAKWALPRIAQRRDSVSCMTTIVANAPARNVLQVGEISGIQPGDLAGSLVTPSGEKASLSG